MKRMDWKKHRRTVSWGIAGALLAAAGIVFFQGGDGKPQPITFLPSQASFGESRFQLEIADTDAKRSRGLGYRESLCERCGMLFVFDEPGRYAFWMKGMRFPLDIIWLREGVVTYMERDVPADSTTVFRPPEEVDGVLEVNAGQAEALRVGDRVEFR